MKNKDPRKLIVITGGIPENSDKNINKEYAKYLVSKADFIILFNTIFSKEFLEIIHLKDFNNFKIVNSYNESLNYLKKNFNSEEVVIILQPELTDLYY